MSFLILETGCFWYHVLSLLVAWSCGGRSHDWPKQVLQQHKTNLCKTGCDKTKTCFAFFMHHKKSQNSGFSKSQNFFVEYFLCFEAGFVRTVAPLRHSNFRTLWKYRNCKTRLDFVADCTLGKTREGVHLSFSSIAQLWVCALWVFWYLDRPVGCRYVS